MRSYLQSRVQAYVALAALVVPLACNDSDLSAEAERAAAAGSRRNLERANDAALRSCLEAPTATERLRACIESKAIDLALDDGDPNPWHQLLRVFDPELQVLPDFLFDADHIRTLELAGLPITEIPAGIGRMVQLRTLRLDLLEGLDRLPREIGALGALAELHVAGSERLTQLPPEIGQLHSLRVLRLDHNRLTALPSTLADLRDLEELYLSHNLLETIPPELGGLAKLRVVSARENRLQSIPREWCELEELDLDLRGNPLSELALAHFCEDAQAEL